MQEPFLRYRSLERRGRLQRPRRYACSLLVHVRQHERLARQTDRVRLNTECRSYEMGWIVYAWAGRPEDFASRPAHPAVSFAVGG